MSESLRKSVQDLDLGIGDEPIALPPEFCYQAAAVNRFSIVVTTVNPMKQNLRALIHQMPRVWGFPDACVGRIMDGGRVQFKFKSEESMNLVLRRGPWSFNDWMLSTHRWYPNISEAEMKIIPFWVQIQGIPILYLTNAMAGWVGNRLGNVVDVDYDENVNQVGSVRVKINWNMDDPLRFQRNFQFVAGENTIVKFRFERLRNFCSKCGSLKHDVKECVMGFSDEEPEPEGSDDDNDDDQPFDGKDNNMSDSETIPSVDPTTLIPGLQMLPPKSNSRKAYNSPVSSGLPSAFEDTELTAERLRYLHVKFAKQHCVFNDQKDDVLEGETENALNEYRFIKRKRVRFEVNFNKAEAAEELAVLSHLRKKGKKLESSSSFSVTQCLDRGAGGPVPPEDPI